MIHFANRGIPLTLFTGDGMFERGGQCFIKLSGNIRGNDLCHSMDVGNTSYGAIFDLHGTCKFFPS